MKTTVGPEPEEVTRLVQKWRLGDIAAREQLLTLIYPVLKRQANRYFANERTGHTLQPTALVHEVCVKLLCLEAPENLEDCAHILALGSMLMREILVDHSRRRGAIKRGGPGMRRIEWDEALAITAEDNTDIVALHLALNRLRQLNPIQEKVVEMRYFGGMTREQISAVLKVSPKTVQRYWDVARLQLLNDLSGPPMVRSAGAGSGSESLGIGK